MILSSRQGFLYVRFADAPSAEATDRAVAPTPISRRQEVEPTRERQVLLSSKHNDIPSNDVEPKYPCRTCLGCDIAIASSQQ